MQNEVDTPPPTFNPQSTYETPLNTRYTSEAMSSLFSAQKKHSTWRKLWVLLAEGQKHLGLPITDRQIRELHDAVDTIDFETAAQYEKELQHDVMAHIHAYGDQCPSARAIIHLGATSCYVTDNTDLIQIKEGLSLLNQTLKKTITSLSHFAKKHADQPTLGFTHFQPAQLTTVGKRATLWLQDLVEDSREIEKQEKTLKFLGVKGATGTQASFLSLFGGDHQKVEELDHFVTKAAGFTHLYPISGQTYTRKQDVSVVSTLSSFAATAHKIATDLRLLAGLKEIEEPFGKKQVGSSTMPYKRNPMLCERVCALSRHLISLSQNAYQTLATQWLERSLDDSANRRITLSEAFLTADAIAHLLAKITDGLEVNINIINRRIDEELPFVATENILMAAVEKGGDRQTLHEKLRTYSMEVGQEIKKGNVLASENPLLERIIADSDFQLSAKELQILLDKKKFIGRSVEQVQAFLSTIEQ